MSNLQFGTLIALLIWNLYLISRSADGGFVKRRLMEIEGKLDAILVKNGDGANSD